MISLETTEVVGNFISLTTGCEVLLEGLGAFVTTGVIGVFSVTGLAGVVCFGISGTIGVPPEITETNISHE